jgi:hypothetical protein
MMVVLQKDTFQPIRYSEPFCFQHIGIEFCTGFRIDKENRKYILWISKWDRDPLMISFGYDEISC